MLEIAIRTGLLSYLSPLFSRTVVANLITVAKSGFFVTLQPFRSRAILQFAKLSSQTSSAIQRITITAAEKMLWEKGPESPELPSGNFE